jgi:hypothetical protein
MQSSSSNGAEGLVDLYSLGDLVLPADLNNPNDPKVFVVDPRSPEAWKTQVLLLGAGSKLTGRRALQCITRPGRCASLPPALWQHRGVLLLAAIEASGASQLSEHPTECSQLGLLSLLLWLAEWDILI